VTYRPARVVHAFLRGLTRHDAGRTVAVRGTRKPPAVTTADVTRLGITEQVSQFTSYFPDAPGRTAELSAATAVLDGTLLKPGDTLNLADALGLGGAPDIGAGYIADNGVFTQDYGSSTSQVATSVFTAAFMAGLADVEPTPHSIHVVSQPVEGQTSVDWSSAGLAFKDNTRYGVLVQAWVDPSTPAHRGAVQVRFWSTKQWDVRTSASPRYAVTDPATTHGSGPGCVPNHGAQGYTVDLHRDLTGLRGRVRRETVHTIYAPSDRVVCS
jgi:vancomycin resistance protein YoaR